jgi:hypothetical protein
VQQTARLVGRNNSARPRNAGARANGEGGKTTYPKGNGWAVTVMVRRTTEMMRKRGLGGKVEEQCRVTRPGEIYRRYRAAVDRRTGTKAGRGGCVGVRVCGWVVWKDGVMYSEPGWVEGDVEVKQR